jgi:hypothetical protein
MTEEQTEGMNAGQQKLNFMSAEEAQKESKKESPYFQIPLKEATDIGKDYIIPFKGTMAQTESPFKYKDGNPRLSYVFEIDFGGKRYWSTTNVTLKKEILTALNEGKRTLTLSSKFENGHTKVILKKAA